MKISRLTIKNHRNLKDIDICMGEIENQKSIVDGTIKRQKCI